MDKDQAEKALSIIREVIQNTHEDLVEHNWGLIWIFHAFTNAGAFVAIGAWVEANHLATFWYLAPLAVVAVVNLAIIALCLARDRGVQGFIEWQVHGIWISFIVFSLAGAGLLSWIDEPTLFCSLMAFNSGYAFAMMGVIFYRSFFLVAAGYLAIGLVAKPLLGDVYQWYLLAAMAWLAMIVPGVTLFLEKRRRHADGRRSEIL